MRNLCESSIMTTRWSHIIEHTNKYDPAYYSDQIRCCESLHRHSELGSPPVCPSHRKFSFLQPDIWNSVFNVHLSHEKLTNNIQFIHILYIFMPLLLSPHKLTFTCTHTHTFILCMADCSRSRAWAVISSTTSFYYKYLLCRSLLKPNNTDWSKHLVSISQDV